MRPIDAEELKMSVRDLARKIARENGGVDDATWHSKRYTT